MLVVYLIKVYLNQFLLKKRILFSVKKITSFLYIVGYVDTAIDQAMQNHYKLTVESGEISYNASP